MVTLWKKIGENFRIAAVNDGRVRGFDFVKANSGGRGGEHVQDGYVIEWIL